VGISGMTAFASGRDPGGAGWSSSGGGLLRRGGAGGHPVDPLRESARATALWCTWRSRTGRRRGASSNATVSSCAQSRASIPHHGSTRWSVSDSPSRRGDGALSTIRIYGPGHQRPARHPCSTRGGIVGPPASGGPMDDRRFARHRGDREPRRRRLGRCPGAHLVG
jgi:hypothetical protein